MTKEILTAGVTDWVTPLSEVYKRQTIQLEEHHTNLRLRDQQMVDKAKAENVTELFSELAKFTTKAVSAKKKIDDKRMQKFRDKYETKFREKGADYSKGLTLRYRLEANDIDNVDAKLLEQLKKEDINPQLLYDIMSVSGSELRKMSAFMAEDAILAANPHAFIQSLNPEDRGEWDRASNDPNKRADLYKKWISGQIAIFNPSEGLFANHLKSEVDRMSATVLGTGKNKKLSQSGYNKKVTFQSTLSTALKLENGTYNGQTILINEIRSRRNFFKDIPGGKTATQQATDSVVADLRVLVDEGRLNHDALDRLFEDTEALKDHAAGLNIPKAFFDNEGTIETSLFKAAAVFETKRLGLLEAKTETELDLLEAKIIEGSISREERDLEIAKYLGKFTNPTLNTRINNLANLPITNKGAFPELKKKLETSINDGSIAELSNDQIDALYPSAALRQYAINKRDEYKAAQHELGYSKDDDLMISNIIAKRIMNRTLNVDGVTGQRESLPLQAQGLQGELLRKYRSMWAAEYRLNPNNPNITATVNAQFKQELDANGFNVDDDDDNAGIYSPTSNGIFENYAFNTTANVETTNVTTPARYNKHVDDVRSAFDFVGKSKRLPGATLLDKALNIPPGNQGSILSAEDVIGAYENQHYSSEIILKARLLNMTPAELLSRSRDALIASKDEKHKDIVEIYKLKEDELPDPELKIKEAITNAGKYDMLFLLNRKGVENFTPNQYTRLRELLSTEAQFQEEVNRTEGDLEKYARIKRLQTLNIKDVPASALESDEALDNFITQQGLLESK